MQCRARFTYFALLTDLSQGTVGEPGDRSFYLQAVHESRVVSVLLEKQQVQVLADRMGLLLEEVHRRFGTEVPPQADDVSDLSPLVTPLDAEFRVGTMGLGWDADAGAVVVELLAVSETEFDESVVLDDADDGPDRGPCVPDSGGKRASFRCGPNASSRRDARRARCVVNRWRPRGTSCIRTNGYRRGESFGFAIDDADDDEV